MIKQFKIYSLFESINQGEPIIGDYVYCVEEIGYLNTPELLVFLSTNIGLVCGYNDDVKNNYKYKIHFN